MMQADAPLLNLGSPWLLVETLHQAEDQARGLDIDAAAIGQPKGAIWLGHMLSEDWGMFEVADWLKTFITDVPIEWISAREPFSPRPA